jgi:hypothetical protein
MIWYILGAIAFAIGIYIGLGYPGLPGREDRVVHQRTRRIHKFTPLDLLRPPKR